MHIYLFFLIFASKHILWVILNRLKRENNLAPVRKYVMYMGVFLLVYKFKKLIGSNDFSFQFRQIITRYRRIGYNLNVMRQSACLVFNPITVDNYAAFFNCTPVGRASDSMMAPT